MKTTYFKVDRDIQNNWLWQDKPFSRGQAWIDLLLMATHTDNKVFRQGQLTERKRGEVHTSIKFLCDRWGWSKSKVLHFIELLTADEMITTKSTTKGTILTIEKYAFYQGAYKTKSTTEDTAKRLTEDTAKRLTEDTAKRLQTKKNNKDKELLIISNNINNNFREHMLTDEQRRRLAEMRERVRNVKANSN